MDDSAARRHVLVLDDDEVMRELLETLLSLEGYEVEVASSGKQALEMLRGGGGRIDVVLTDLQMPELEGEALVARLRGAISGKTLLVGMSGGVPRGGLPAELDAFVQKPFELDRFEEAVRQAAAARMQGERNGVAGLVAGGRSEAGEVRPTLNEEIFGALGKSIPVRQLVELYELTLADVRRRHERMETAAADGDLATVQREAHAVKGSCGMVGATELQGLAAEVEGGTTLNTSALAEFPAACVRLRRMLDAKLQTA